MVDILRAKKAFKEYISNYDINEPRINIKITHMYQVAKNARNISKSLGLSEEGQDLAELIGLLHDIGRFEQVRVYHTFSDKLSIDHAEKGIEILFENRYIRNFIDDTIYDNIIYKAILNHNKIKIQEGLSNKELLYTQIIRDADNIDIFRAVLDPNQRIEDFGHIGCKDISKEKLSKHFFENFKKEKTLVYSDAKSDMDIMVAIIAHIFTINFKKSLEIIRDNDYINKFIKRLDCQEEYTKERLQEIAEISMRYINKKVEENKIIKL